MELSRLLELAGVRTTAPVLQEATVEDAGWERSANTPVPDIRHMSSQEREDHFQKIDDMFQDDKHPEPAWSYVAAEELGAKNTNELVHTNSQDDDVDWHDVMKNFQETKSPRKTSSGQGYGSPPGGFEHMQRGTYKGDPAIIMHEGGYQEVYVKRKPKNNRNTDHTDAELIEAMENVCGRKLITSSAGIHLITFTIEKDYFRKNKAHIEKAMTDRGAKLGAEREHGLDVILNVIT